MDKVIIKFWGPGCINCKMMEPTMKQLEGEYPDIKFQSVNIAEQEELAEKYEIQSLPTLVFLKNDKVVAKMVGLKPKSLVVKKIAEIF